MAAIPTPTTHQQQKNRIDMSRMEPGEEEYEEGETIEIEDERASERKEQGARPFFALICFLIAVICLTIFLNRSLDSLTGLVVLFGVIIFGIGGMLLLDRKPSQKPNPYSSMNILNRQDSENEASIVDSTLVGSTDKQGEDEEETEDDSLIEFEMLVEDALSSIPVEFHVYMANLAVLVEREPGEAVLQRVGVKEGYTLLGLYQGVPLNAYGRSHTMLPERITIYQQTIEDYCHGDPQRIREQVRSTVLHEVAHHFGMDHEEMPIWIK